MPYFIEVLESTAQFCSAGGESGIRGPSERKDETFQLVTVSGGDLQHPGATQGCYTWIFACPLPSNDLAANSGGSASAFRDIVGRAEIWRSLEVTDRRRAGVLCASISLELETEWEAELKARNIAAPEGGGERTNLNHRQAHALAGDAYREYVAEHAEEPGTAAERRAALESHERKGRPPAFHKRFMLHAYWTPIMKFLDGRGLRLDPDSLERFATAFFAARGSAEKDLLNIAGGDFGSSGAGRFPPPLPPKLDAVESFKAYAAAAGLKDSTIKRWRPVFDALAPHLGHSDLGRLTKLEVVAWKDALLTGKPPRAPRTVRDVYLAAVKATCQYLVDEMKLKENPVTGVVVRNVNIDKDDDKKGFNETDAATILAACLAPPPKKMFAEMAAARRWVPWICAYTGARVNELTSLLPGDFIVRDGLPCISIRGELTKTSKPRIVPLHDHLVEQGLLDYVGNRRELGKPLFYDPSRGRGAKRANPHWTKVGNKLADWVGDLDVDHEVAPNHGWRHRFKAVARDVEMHPEISDFITGHGAGSVSKKYGARWVTTFKKQIDKIPRYVVTASSRPIVTSGRRAKLAAPVSGEAA